uniref:Uncharacterized protein n=1 Tax=Schistocephalus solidus TaxID=70667 RepID=A0A0V0J6Y2_SCHSO
MPGNVIDVEPQRIMKCAEGSGILRSVVHFESNRHYWVRHRPTRSENCGFTQIPNGPPRRILAADLRELTLVGGSTLQSSDINGGLTPQRSLSVGPKPTSEAEMGRQSLLRLPEDVNLRSKPESPYRDINY